MIHYNIMEKSMQIKSFTAVVCREYFLSGNVAKQSIEVAVFLGNQQSDQNGSPKCTLQFKVNMNPLQNTDMKLIMNTYI